jgi:hypothetical protein
VIYSSKRVQLDLGWQIAEAKHCVIEQKAVKGMAVVLSSVDPTEPSGARVSCKQLQGKTDLLRAKSSDASNCKFNIQHSTAQKMVDKRQSTMDGSS